MSFLFQKSSVVDAFNAVEENKERENKKDDVLIFENTRND